MTHKYKELEKRNKKMWKRCKKREKDEKREKDFKKEKKRQGDIKMMKG